MSYEVNSSNMTSPASAEHISLSPWRSFLVSMIYYAEPIMAGLNFVNVSSNLINIAVFLRMRLADIMSLGLFFLSVSDFTSAFIGFLASFSVCLNRTTVGPVLNRYINLDMFWIHILGFTLTSYNFANNVTSFVAIERCLFVAMPLKGKQLITKTRAWVAILLMLLFAFLTNMPYFVTGRMVVVFNPVFNRSRLEFIYNDNRRMFQRYLQIFQLLVIGPISVAIVCVTSYIMIRALKRSAKFRSAMKAGGNETTKQSDSHKGTNQNVSDNNIRLVKMLLILSLSTAGIHVCSICFGIGSAANPEFYSRGKLGIEYGALIYVFQFLYAFNQIINMFLYYHYNTKFRTEFKRMVSPCIQLCCCFRKPET